MRLSRLVALACCGAIASTVALWPTDAIAQAKSAAAMGQAVNTFLASLTPEQRARAVTRFDDEERFNWNERPMARPGVVLKELTEPQRRLAMDLLRTSVGEGGLHKIQMSLAREPVLSATQATPEGASLRDPFLFYVSVFGTPSATESLGMALRRPSHLGELHDPRRQDLERAAFHRCAAERPVRRVEGARTARQAADNVPPALAVRMMVGEEDKARALVQALDPSQRAIVVFDRTEERDADMLTGINNRRTTPLDPPGLVAGQMTPEQKTLLVALVEEYLTRMPADVAAERRGRLLEGTALDAIAFQWHGGIERGQAHNYTVQGPTFIIEYAQSRGGNVGHVHTIWRDFDGDFGENILGTR